MYYIGIDLSLTATAIVVLSEKAVTLFQGTISTKANEKIEDRFLKIEKYLFNIIKTNQPSRINIEGLSYSSKGQATLDSAGLHFLIRTTLRRNKIPFRITPPTTLKKFVSGKGNCKKNLMLKEAYKKWGEDFFDDNICDAYSLSRYEMTL